MRSDKSIGEPRSFAEDRVNRSRRLQARVKELQAQARELAALEVDALRASLDQAAAHAREILTTPDAFPVGVREHARRLAEDLPAIAIALEGLMERARQDGARREGLSRH